MTLLLLLGLMQTVLYEEFGLVKVVVLKEVLKTLPANHFLQMEEKLEVSVFLQGISGEFEVRPHVFQCLPLESEARVVIFASIPLLLDCGNLYSQRITQTMTSLKKI